MPREKPILLVDDMKLVRDAFALVLRAQGYAVDVAATLAEACQALDKHVYAMVITDRRLPDGDGVQVADKAAGRGAKTLLVSGYLDDDAACRHENLMKPLRPHELISAVERSIGKADDGVG